MKGRPIKLTFISEVKRENTSFDANGLYYIKGDATYICFDEAQEVGIVKNIVKINGDEVLITRSGPISMRQAFKKKKQTSGMLKSPFGHFLMETKTENVEYHYKNARGKLFISYILKLNGEEIGRHSITIKFKEDLK